jgi:UDP-N-acetylmuramate--alanine ligase
MQYKGEFNGIKIFDDYGHHPTEIRATLQGVKEKFPHSKVLVLFQPHRFSRTQFCWDEFLTCFQQADTVFVTDIYAAGEPPIVGIDGAHLAKQCVHSRCHFVPKTKLLDELKQMSVQHVDLILTLGAGDIWKVGEALINEPKN